MNYFKSCLKWFMFYWVTCLMISSWTQIQARKELRRAGYLKVWGSGEIMKRARRLWWD